ncbi:hypothetical protein C8Q70DRAFT_1054365 [Cubamyces menziesii]|nr:hypothetical protein C8Q70DRAFT_1054365 [Cubamyces menziesii]
MSHLRTDVQCIMDELAKRIPGCYTIYLRRHARGSHQSNAADAASKDTPYLPGCVIECRNASTAKLCRAVRETHGFGAGDFYVPFLAVPGALAVERVPRILLYASNHTSAIVLTQGSLAAWGSTLDDAWVTLQQMHHAIQMWERDGNHPLSNVAHRRIAAQPPSLSSNVDERFNEYDEARQASSNARSAGSNEGTLDFEVDGGFDGFRNLLSLPDEASLTPDMWTMSSSASNGLEGIDLHQDKNSPMLGDSPVGFSLSRSLSVGGQCSYDHSPSISPACTVVDLASSSPLSDTPSSPLTVVPSQLSSPLVRSGTPKLDDAWMAIDADLAGLHTHASELNDFFTVDPSFSSSDPLPVTSSSSGIVPSQSLLTRSSSPEPAHCLSPHPEIILISPADDSSSLSAASALTSSPDPARGRRSTGRTRRLPPPTSRSSLTPASPDSLSIPRLTRSHRAIQRSEEKPSDEGMPSVRPIRSLLARAARSGRHPPMEPTSSLPTLLAGPSRSSAIRRSDENEDDDDSDVDNDESGDYCPRTSSESSSGKRRSKRQSSSGVRAKKAKQAEQAGQEERPMCPMCSKECSRWGDVKRHRQRSCKKDPNSLGVKRVTSPFSSDGVAHLCAVHLTVFRDAFVRSLRARAVGNLSEAAAYQKLYWYRTSL